MNGWKSVHKAKLVPGDLENADIKNMGVYIRNLMLIYRHRAHPESTSPPSLDRPDLD